MADTPTFDRVEEHWSEGQGQRYVILSFRTRNLGVVQVQTTRLNGEWKFKTLKNEPDLHMLPESAQLYIHKISMIVYRMIFDAPLASDRFE